jgi:hypothetical protein
VLVKQLQKEVARLEAELRVPEGNEACSSDALLHAKDLQIQQVGWFCPCLHSYSRASALTNVLLPNITY